ncbi:hypothetical protein HY419_01665, partial [candidate division WWE3 bacterium]|nr:hypothetical protein [candidate division WWE3 bacterium]
FMVVTLILVLMAAAFSFPPFLVLKNVLTTVSFCLLFDLLFLKLRRIKTFRLSAAVVSGLILAVLLSPSSKLEFLALSSLIAMTSKNFIRFSNFHLFNPAAFGALTAGIILADYPSWWAVSFGFAPILIAIGLSGYLSAFKLKKWPTILGFYLTYALLASLGLLNFERALDFTTAFFVMVMLVEPMTSPDKIFDQIIYSVFVATLAIFTPIQITSFFGDIFLYALLAGNILSFYLVRLRKAKSPRGV